MAKGSKGSTQGGDERTGLSPAVTNADAPPSEHAIEDYAAVLAEVANLIESARRAAARAVSSVMASTYWMIGRRIVEQEQGGRQRAGYGEALIARLAYDLSSRFGRGSAGAISSR